MLSQCGEGSSQDEVVLTTPSVLTTFLANYFKLKYSVMILIYMVVTFQ